MKAPLFVRSFTEEEQQAIQAGLHAPDAFTLRRCQILRASARGERAIAIARELGCDDQTVRNVVKKFNVGGLSVLQAGSSRPYRLQTAMDSQAMEQIPSILRRPPRDFGLEQSLWSLQALAQVCFEQGLTARLVSIEGMRKILRRLDINWKRVKHRINSPDTQYEVKKTLVTD